MGVIWMKWAGMEGAVVMTPAAFSADQLRAMLAPVPTSSRQPVKLLW